MVKTSAGPSALKNADSAAKSAAVPAATASPATATIGPNRAVAARAASCLSAPALSSVRRAEKKNTA